MRDKIFAKLNALVRRSYWYNNILFPDCVKFWRQSTFNLDIVNLGSSSALHAFDYSDISLKTANWAMAPQTLREDFEILKNYSSFLKSEKPIVIIPLCPFTCLSGSSFYMPDKYYTLLKLMSIPNADYRKKKVIMDMKNNPVKYYPLVEFYRDLLFLFKRLFRVVNKSKDRVCIDYENNARTIFNCWLKEFSIFDLKDDLMLHNRDMYNDTIELLKEMLDFCLDRGFVPILTIPPISKHLLKYFTCEAKQKFIYDFVNAANEKDVLFLNYMEDADFFDVEDYFENALLLNKNGACAFTKKILTDVQNYISSNMV